MINTSQEKNLRGPIIALLFLTGATAIGAGYSFMADPSGSSIGIPLWYIRHSGFRSYFIPGMILFIAVGIFGVFTAWAVIARRKSYPLLVLLYGAVLTGWIAIQIILVRDFNLLHLLCAVIGLSLVSSYVVLQRSNIV